jgi:hypothetical protein
MNCRPSIRLPRALFKECHPVYAGVHLLDEDGHTAPRFCLPGESLQLKGSTMLKWNFPCVILHESSGFVQVPEPGSCPFPKVDLPSTMSVMWSKMKIVSEFGIFA